MFDCVLPLLFFNNADLQTTQSAMDAARKYYDTLKPICVQVQVTFEDRDRLRKEIRGAQFVGSTQAETQARRPHVDADTFLHEGVLGRKPSTSEIFSSHTSMNFSVDH